mmetsp:Transcript_16403/g.24056  ORF Transcript_16403/g.24056 Transcript_16403/m.24056 type:complete len:223 (-) Transcript_16403:365-1033(-)|eukprot:CAMPEP_0195517938 /NCGR_PEP_ID=MMETSP0794_2-20130614/11833_1 /TAXON_ID=515487 /ORGANISM="Stephanopyxis turris, Strain CCMP 815" /LENGTH=222 /DNA_ID=CAMNT_0040646821 /DNA_START=116 /DNA_END=784 /DNA_ORIENTATION=-
MGGAAGPEWSAITKIVSQIYARSDAEPFRDAVDWKALGLYDYPQIVKRPMDLGIVKRKLETAGYKSIHDAAEDVRLVWKNCMEYNADGSDFYILAQNLSKRFEDKFAKVVKETNSGKGSGAASAAEPTLDEKKAFAKSLYKITKEQLGQVIVDLEKKCPASLTKNSAEDEVEINVDHIAPAAFHEVLAYVRSCGEESSASSSGRKKKSAGSKSSSNKKSRIS